MLQNPTPFFPVHAAACISKEKQTLKAITGAGAATGQSLPLCGWGGDPGSRRGRVGLQPAAERADPSLGTYGSPPQRDLPLPALLCLQSAESGCGQPLAAGRLREEMRTLLFFSREVQHSSLVKY